MSTTAAVTSTDTARAFSDACDTGKGWEACSAYCHADATFAAQAEPLADVTTVKIEDGKIRHMTKIWNAA